jgi:hypothetical protein
VGSQSSMIRYSVQAKKGPRIERACEGLERLQESRAKTALTLFALGFASRMLPVCRITQHRQCSHDKGLWRRSFIIIIIDYFYCFASPRSSQSVRGPQSATGSPAAYPPAGQTGPPGSTLGRSSPPPAGGPSRQTCCIFKERSESRPAIRLPEAVLMISILLRNLVFFPAISLWRLKHANRNLAQASHRPPSDERELDSNVFTGK